MMTLCCFCDCLLLIVKAADGLRDTQRAKEKRGTSKAAASSGAADWEKAGALAALLTYTLRLRPWKVHSGYSTHPPPSLQIAVGGSGFVSKLLTLEHWVFYPISSPLTSFTPLSIYHAVELSSPIFPTDLSNLDWVNQDCLHWKRWITMFNKKNSFVKKDRNFETTGNHSQDSKAQLGYLETEIEHFQTLCLHKKDG